MRLEWEAYFLEMEQEKENRRQHSRKRRRWIPAGLLLLCVLLGAGIFLRLRDYDAEYARMEKAMEQWDTRLAAVRMSEFLNEKYGAGTCEPADLDISGWDPTTGREYLSLRGISAADPAKRVFLLYLSPKQPVYLDTWQWEEISGALQEEAAKRLGLREMMVDSVIPTELSYSKSEYYCPWRQTGAFLTRYEGDLEAFFAGEKAARAQLPDLDTLQEEQLLNGSFALYLKAPSVPDMETRVQNPRVLEPALYEKELRAMEKLYQVNLFSCVLTGSHYEALRESLLQKELYQVFPTTYADYGKGSVFYNPAFALLSYAYGEAYAPQAEEAAPGVWLFSTDREKELELFQYQEREAIAAMEEAAQQELPGWCFEESFSIAENPESGKYVRHTSVIALDLQKRYPEREVALMEKAYRGWMAVQEENQYPAGIYHDVSCQREDGFLIVNGGLGDNNEMYYGVWSR